MAKQMVLVDNNETKAHRHKVKICPQARDDYTLQTYYTSE